MLELLDTLETGIKGAFRIGQTTKVLTETGIGWLLGDRKPAPNLLRTTFERLGSTYIKLGQFIASAPSIFPAEYVEEFQYCLDKTEALPFSEIKKVLKKELKRPLDEIYAEIDPEPLASASIAQVHAARLVTGESVVIKVQKPGVQDILLTDLNFLYGSAKVLEFIAPGLSRTSLSAIIGDIQASMMEECDFLKEAQNMNEFNEFLERTGNTEALAPKVYAESTTLRVLTMERFYGVPLTDLESIRKYSKNPELTLITALNTWFSSLMENEFFHADVHAGNLMVLEDGRIGFIDFGIVGRIRRETWGAMMGLMESMSTEDYPRMADCMVQIGITEETVDKSALAADLKKLYSKAQTLDPTNMASMKEEDINRFMLDLVELGEKNGLRFPREFALLIKQFLYFDRYTRILAPEMNMFADDRLNRLN